MQSCQQNVDTAFAIAMVVPIVTAMVATAWIARSPSVESIDDGTIFEDPDTGAIFTSAEGVTPERDRQVCDHSDLRQTLNPASLALVYGYHANSSDHFPECASLRDAQTFESRSLILILDLLCQEVCCY
jgi:hypothetical protein